MGVGSESSQPLFTEGGLVLSGLNLEAWGEDGQAHGNLQYSSIWEDSNLSILSYTKD